MTRAARVRAAVCRPTPPREAKLANGEGGKKRIGKREQPLKSRRRARAHARNDDESNSNSNNNNNNDNRWPSLAASCGASDEKSCRHTRRAGLTRVPSVLRRAVSFTMAPGDLNERFAPDTRREFSYRKNASADTFELCYTGIPYRACVLLYHAIIRSYTAAACIM